MEHVRLVIWKPFHRNDKSNGALANCHYKELISFPWFYCNGALPSRNLQVTAGLTNYNGYLESLFEVQAALLDANGGLMMDAVE